MKRQEALKQIRYILGADSLGDIAADSWHIDDSHRNKDYNSSIFSLGEGEFVFSSPGQISCMVLPKEFDLLSYRAKRYVKLKSSYFYYVFYLKNENKIQERRNK